MTTRYAALDTHTQAQLLEYLRWCRDLLLVFMRYGSARTRVVLNNLEMTNNLREGVWNQTAIFDDWFQRSRGNIAVMNNAEVEGWIISPPTPVPGDDAMDGQGPRRETPPVVVVPQEVLEGSRIERTRLLSLDGLSDPRNDRVELDEDFAILHDLSVFDNEFQAVSPRNDPSSTEVELGTQQDLVFSLEGRFPLMPRLYS
jgi:hypothetical protein